MPAMLLAAAFVTALAIALLAETILVSRFGWLAPDLPNERSMHRRPVPRTGGIGVLAGAAAACVFGATTLWVPMVLALLLAVVSFMDDLRRLPTLLRLATHLGVAAFSVWYLLPSASIPVLLLLTLSVAWITNLYNFMDGSDGVAG